MVVLIPYGEWRGFDAAFAKLLWPRVDIDVDIELDSDAVVAKQALFSGRNVDGIIMSDRLRC